MCKLIYSSYERGKGNECEWDMSLGCSNQLAPQQKIQNSSYFDELNLTPFAILPRNTSMAIGWSKFKTQFFPWSVKLSRSWCLCWCGQGSQLGASAGIGLEARTHQPPLLRSWWWAERLALWNSDHSKEYSGNCNKILHFRRWNALAEGMKLSEKPTNETIGVSLH